MIEKNKVVKFQEREFNLSYPTVRQHLNIESKKQSLSNQNYGAMMSSMTRDSMHALNLIDAIATFSTLIENFDKIIEVPVGSSYLDIDQFTAKELVAVYTNQYLPWKKDLDSFLDGPIK